MMVSENTILTKALETLRSRLPAGWSLGVVRQAPQHDGPVDSVVRVVAPDGRLRDLGIVVKRAMDPRFAQSLVQGARSRPPALPLLAVAEWMSRGVRDALRMGGIDYLDLTGNIRLVMAEPGLFVETAGADRNPSPDRPGITLRGDKAADVVHVLCMGRPPMGVRRIAASAGTTPGYVSKLLVLLHQQAAVERTEDGQVKGVDIRRLVERWAEDAPLEVRVDVTTWIAPRGITAFLERLRTWEGRYAVTGSQAASRRAPVAPPRLISVYVDEIEAFANGMGLRPAEAGVNVRLLVPSGDAAFRGLWEEEGVRFAALPRVAADLLSEPGRGLAQAEALLDWMTDHPEVWRG